MKRSLQRRTAPVLIPSDMLRHNIVKQRKFALSSHLWVSKVSLCSSEKQFWLQSIRTKAGPSENAVGWSFGLCRNENNDVLYQTP
jgi:hypothetical protein